MRVKIDRAANETSDPLAGLFGFTSDELDANRRGILTEGQRSRLIMRVRVEMGLLALGMVFPFALVMMMAIAINPALSSFVSLGVLALLLAVLAKSLRLRRDTAARQVEAATGAFQFTPGRYRGGLTHTASGLALQYPPGMLSKANPFDEAAHYTVYYVPGSNVIVSAEPVEA